MFEEAVVTAGSHLFVRCRVGNKRSTNPVQALYKPCSILIPTLFHPYTNPVQSLYLGKAHLREALLLHEEALRINRCKEEKVEKEEEEKDEKETKEEN